MTATRITSIAVEIIRIAVDTSGVGTAAGTSTAAALSPNNRQPVVCIITN